MSVSSFQPTANALAASKPQDELVSAVERLAFSRARLRGAMMPPAKANARGLGDGIAGFALNFVDRIEALPGARLLLEAFQSWWAQHPLHTAGRVAAEATRKIAVPIAERRPLTLLAGAALAGAALALTRPWRWMLKPALFAGLVPAVAARLIRELPIDSWLNMLATLSAPAAAPASTSSSASTATPPLRPLRPASAEQYAPRPSPSLEALRPEATALYP